MQRISLRLAAVLIAFLAVLLVQRGRTINCHDPEEEDWRAWVTTLSRKAKAARGEIYAATIREDNAAVAALEPIVKDLEERLTRARVVLSAREEACRQRRPWMAVVHAVPSP